MQVNPFAPDRSRVDDLNVGLAAINMKIPRDDNTPWTVSRWPSTEASV